MTHEIPQYCMRAFALFFSRHGSIERFGQSELDWIVGSSMKKKIFSCLVRSGWITKATRDSYRCIEPGDIVKGILNFRVQEVIKKAERNYCFTGLSAVEIWSDFAYIQRGIDKSPYFIKILKKDMAYWKTFFSGFGIPVYVKHGRSIGEYVILLPVGRLDCVDKDGLRTEKYSKTAKIAKNNEMFRYAFNYMEEKYGSAA